MTTDYALVTTMGLPQDPEQVATEVRGRALATHGHIDPEQMITGLGCCLHSEAEGTDGLRDSYPALVYHGPLQTHVAVFDPQPVERRRQILALALARVYFGDVLTDGQGRRGDFFLCGNSHRPGEGVEAERRADRFAAVLLGTGNPGGLVS